MVSAGIRPRVLECQRRRIHLRQKIHGLDKSSGVSPGKPTIMSVESEIAASPPSPRDPLQAFRLYSPHHLQHPRRTLLHRRLNLVAKCRIGVMPRQYPRKCGGWCKPTAGLPPPAQPQPAIGERHSLPDPCSVHFWPALNLVYAQIGIFRASSRMKNPSAAPCPRISTTNRGIVAPFNNVMYAVRIQPRRELGLNVSSVCGRPGP